MLEAAQREGRRSREFSLVGCLPGHTKELAYLVADITAICTSR